jgi:hypothetical protein
MNLSFNGTRIYDYSSKGDNHKHANGMAVISKVTIP